MHFIKKLFRGFTLFLFVWFISLVALVAALVMTFNTPNKIEKSLSDSGVYSTFVDNILQEAAKSTKKTGSNIPTDDPEVKKIITSTFTSEFLQNSTENLLDGTYNWLSGKTQLPNFYINLTAQRTAVGKLLASHAADRLKTLPRCTTAQFKTIDINNIDPFKVPCLPPGMNIAQEQKALEKKILNNKDFLNNPVITAQNLPKDKNGKTVFDQLAQLPKAYKWVNASPWLLALLAILTGVVAFLLHDSRRRGLRNIAIAFGITGTLMLLANSASTWGLNKVSAPNGALTRAAKSSFQPTIISAIKSIHSSFAQVYVWFAIAYLVLAIAILLALRFIKPRRVDAKPADKKEPTPPIDDSPKQKLPKPDAPKPINKN